MAIMKVETVSQRVQQENIITLSSAYSRRLQSEFKLTNNIIDTIKKK